MEDHNCSVCLEEITATTSSATLSCGHNFHFGCLGKWITTSGNESCPYCRHKLEEKEQILREDSDESENSADELLDIVNLQDADQREWLSSMRLQVTFMNPHPRLPQEERKLEIPPYNAEAHAFWQMRTLFERAEEGLPNVEPKEAPLHASDKYAKYRKRKIPYGRMNWSHLGLDYKLTPVESAYDSE